MSFYKGVFTVLYQMSSLKISLQKLTQIIHNLQ